MEPGQDILKILGIDLDIAAERSKGNVISPERDQLEAAKHAGYNFLVTVPGQILRDDLVRKVQACFMTRFSGAINFYSEDYRFSAAVLKPSRPKQLYQILLKADEEVDHAEPKTMGQTFFETVESLKEANMENPALNLTGLTLEEYLMAQVTRFQAHRNWFEPNTTTWLLEEEINSPENPDSCLRAYFRVNSLGVGACPKTSQRAKRGARFTLIPKFQSSEEWEPKNQLT